MNIQINYSAKKVISFLAIIAVSISIISLILSIIVIGFSFENRIINVAFNLFYLDQERNLPTWFTSLLLIMNGLLLLLIAHRTRLMKLPHMWYWLILGVVFVGLSLDETAQLHEKLIEPVRTLFDTSGYLYFAWIIPAVIALVVGGLLYIPFFMRLPAKTRNMFFLAGLIYIGGVILLEALAGDYYAVLDVIQDGQHDMRYALMAHVEETMEMIGLLVFFYALNSYVIQYRSSSMLHEKEK